MGAILKTKKLTTLAEGIIVVVGLAVTLGGVYFYESNHSKQATQTEVATSPAPAVTPDTTTPVTNGNAATTAAAISATAPTGAPATTGSAAPAVIVIKVDTQFVHKAIKAVTTKATTKKPAKKDGERETLNISNF